MGVLFVVAGDEGEHVEVEDAFHRTFGGFFEDFVHFFNGGVFFGFADEVEEGNGWGWDANGDAVEFVFEFRDDYGDCVRGVGGGGDDVDGGGAGAS